MVITEYELVWRCTKFKNQSHQDKRKVVKEQNLCLKCLQIGHFARTCPKPRFRCQEEGCNKDHKTLTHPPSAGLSDAGVSQSRSNQEGTEVNVSRDMGGMASDGATVTAVTVPIKVLVKDSSLMPVNTYALLDSGYVLSDSLPCEITREVRCKWNKVAIHFIRDDRLEQSGESTNRPCSEVYG